MRFSILDFDDWCVYWIACRVGRFTFFIATEKWWSHGHEHVIGIRFGNKVYERRFKNE